MGSSNRLGCKVCLCTVLLLGTLTLASPVASGKTPYWIQTFGVSWTNQTVDVSIPAGPGMARHLVVQALDIWNQAQLWFEATYFPRGRVYTFVVDNRPLDVLVDFTDYWSVSNYCPSVPLGVEGCTNVTWNLSRNITRAIVFLDTKRLITPNMDSIFLVLHEFGHALGLPDLPSLCPFQDLSCLYYADHYPSTLDLYALHELADGMRETMVSLPPTIPYQYYSPSQNFVSSILGTAISTTAAIKASMTIESSEPQSDQLAILFLATVICLGSAIFVVIVKRSR